ncbi:MAG: tRNA 5-methoxyuridine(34)/uridine 5-oxyacetic acid(34) synthase CmoB [Pseudohongiellaceae bacterium]
MKQDIDFSSLAANIKGTALEPLTPLLQAEFLDSIIHGDFRRWRQLLRQLPNNHASSVALGDVVCLGQPDELNEADTATLREQLQAFIPWRKGPFRIFGIHIDSEWQCQIKWQRLANRIQPLAKRKVLDVGCGNGYFGFRMLEQGAKLVVGIDQHPPYVAQFWAIKHFQPDLPLYVIPAALEQLPAELAAAFDTVFSMGVLYHRPSPIDHIRRCHDCLVPGGELVLETLYVDGEEGYCLTPENRYAHINNVWFVPGIKTLLRWLSRCGFSQLAVLDESTTTAEEQRKTEWMPYDSLEAALSNKNPALTVEGLPAPRRVIISAVRAK